jgi:aryl-alcohol dehydrogenase-like predicted oxidoreductase
MCSVLLCYRQGPDVFPIPGTKRIKYLEENAAAYFVNLTAEDKAFLEDTFHEDKVSASALSFEGDG